MKADVHSSVTRIAELENREYDVEALDREDWSTGDYVFARVTERPRSEVRVENPRGRPVELMEGETVVGALGTRRATRGFVGGWRDVEDDGVMQVMTRGGVLGRTTSTSPYSPTPIEVEYEGHVFDDGVERMEDHAVEAVDTDFDTPVVMVLGTSMSAGKTMSGRVVTRVLVDQGYSVAACKLAGAGAYQDMLSLEVSGAEAVYDFVDAGLPTTVVPEDVFRERIEPLLGYLDGYDVVVAELGASPLEPYNGEIVAEMLEDDVAFTLLCASDPYSVVGLREAFGRSPDLVTGIATNTSAGVDLVEELTDCPALNLQEVEAKQPLEEMLVDALD